jgi:hypothetical protein
MFWGTDLSFYLEDFDEKQANLRRRYCCGATKFGQKKPAE